MKKNSKLKIFNWLFQHFYDICFQKIFHLFLKIYRKLRKKKYLLFPRCLEFLACIVVRQLRLVSCTNLQWLDRIFLRKCLGQIGRSTQICPHLRNPTLQFCTPAYFFFVKWRRSVCAAVGCCLIAKQL